MLLSAIPSSTCLGPWIQLSSAYDGVKALELLETGAEPCLALLDLMMPRMDGFEFLETFRDRDLVPTSTGSDDGGHDCRPPTPSGSALKAEARGGAGVGQSKASPQLGEGVGGKSILSRDSDSRKSAAAACSAGCAYWHGCGTKPISAASQDGWTA